MRGIVLKYRRGVSVVIEALSFIRLQTPNRHKGHPRSLAQSAAVDIDQGELISLTGRKITQ